MIDLSIEKLVNYAIEKGLIEQSDRVWAENALLAALRLDCFTRPEETGDCGELEPIPAELIDYAGEHGLIDDSITEKDLLDSRLMGILTPKPSEVISRFRALYAESPEKATEYYYRLSRASDYIRSYRGQGQGQRLSQVPALPRGRGLRGQTRLSRPRQSPPDSDGSQRRELLPPVFPLCLL